MLRKGLVYVIVQFGCMIVLLKNTYFDFLAWSIIPQLLGVVLGSWAIYSVRNARPNVIPEVHKEAILIATGPYKWIRHPMYTSIILFFLPSVIVNNNASIIFIYLLLIVTLVLKLRYEEFLLGLRFKEYKEYKRKTAKLIPFLF